MKKSLILCTLLIVSHCFAQKKVENDPQKFQTLKWRNIGPFRAGRSLAVSGVINQPNVYYFGATGGGVWKSTDRGQNWSCVSDTTFKSSSVGAIAVAPSNANIVYVGMGEGDIRGNISFGDGMYKSTNAGKSWKHVGLPKADGINAIQIHPTNPDKVWISALGNPFGKNPERGIFKTSDGGKSWQKVLYKNDSTGATDIKMDPSNPDILYASLWQGYRTPHSMSSGGQTSGLYKSIDGGETWSLLSFKPGMPVGIVGKIGIAVSPVNPMRVWALIEHAEKGGLYKSDDGGDTWKHVSEDKNIRQRPWYYSMIHPDPSNIDGLIVTNVNLMRTTDGGKTFKDIDVQHGDTHDLWWNPADAQNFIVGDDGGAEVTFDGGATFSDIDIPTGQFYHVSVDNEFPYNIYGAQQDNSSIRIASRTKGRSIGRDAWFPVAGGEAGYIAADPLNANITYGGEYDGQITKYNKTLDIIQDVSVYPESHLGAGASEKKLRFQWTYPIVFSPHDPTRLFITSQFVHTSTDGGQSWQTISPDLTTNDKTRQQRSGGPITKDNTGAEVYCTIFTFAESPIEKGVYWTGSDDGLIHVSKDGGQTWQNITPSEKLIPKYSLISIIDASAHAKGSCVVAVTAYRSGNKKPMILKTIDYGKTWKSITNGLPDDEYVRVVREDPFKPGVLYAGTERGLWICTGDGQIWQKFQANLPTTPVHDIAFQKQFKDMVIATHGRAFWVLDDISIVHNLIDNAHQTKLLPISAAYRLSNGQYGRGEAQGENPKSGAKIHYYLAEAVLDSVKMVIRNASNDTVAVITDTQSLEGKKLKIDQSFYRDLDKLNPAYLSKNKGLNEYIWSLTYAAPPAVDGTNIMWSGQPSGATVLPGIYKVDFYISDKLLGSETLEVKTDPRIKVSEQDYQAQFDLLSKINNKIKEAHTAINQIKKVKKVLGDLPGSISNKNLSAEVTKWTEPLTKTLKEVEEELMQPNASAFQDLLAMPIRLNDKLNWVAGVVSSADSKPTKGSNEVFEDLSKKVDEQIAKLKSVFEKSIPEINKKLVELNIPHISEK